MEALYQYIIFDLDGTLIKSEEGLYDSITYALEKSGVDPGDRKDMKRMIGPVLWESFRKFYNMSAEEADRANAFFFEAYDKEGLYNASVYEGVEQMLETLRNADRILLVVTAKPRDMAERVLNHTGIDRYFQAVIGPARGKKKTDKGSLLKEAFSFLAKSGTDHFQKEQAVMVGDRMFDIQGAVETGIRSIGVLYGYGDRQELINAGATLLADTPADVVKLICRE
ncbi:MAG: HAD hydrolase-like protein [Mogibacterium sp.]|nr:HAD hydrolase-like protein [Mogibacterium sp.]MBQ6500670.1 HAD hydrolase-like protein [Mogibacterium sp.]